METRRCCSFGSLLALHVFGLPVVYNELTTRDVLVDIIKPHNEGSLSETLEVSGWIISTRSFTVCLLTTKHKDWTNQITSILNNDKTGPSYLESLIGRLSDATFIMHTPSHFLNRTTNLHSRYENNNFACLTPEFKKDLRLWLVFLSKANILISINYIIDRQ